MFDSPDQIFGRRDFFRSASALPFALPLGRPAPPATLTFDVPHGGVWRVDVASRTLSLVPRWEDPAVCSGPQPDPISVEFIPRPRVPGGVIVRQWDAADVPRCRLCAVCRAWRHKDNPDVMVCGASTDVDVTDDEAASYSERP